MRVLTDPAETGAVCLALPEDVQTEVVEVPGRVPRGAHVDVYRRPPAPDALARAAALIRAARRPLVVAGGGVVYAEATGGAARVRRGHRDPGRRRPRPGAARCPRRIPSALGAIGATGTPAANRLAREADLVIGVGTRWSDFTTASKSAFQDPGVRFVNVNVAGARRRQAGRARAGGRRAARARRAARRARRLAARIRAWERARGAEAAAWDAEVARLYAAGHGPLPSQAEVIGAVNAAAGERDVVVCAAGSMPGDLHKLWRTTDPDGKGYHVEYGYSCMGYEIPGAMGVKLAAPDREVFAMVGDGSYLMLPGELPTAVAERIKLVIVLVQNHGYASIGALSRSVGGAGYGTHYRVARDGAPAASTTAATTTAVPVDLAANAESLGARVLRARTIDELRAALREARAHAGGPGRRPRRDRPLRGRAELRVAGGTCRSPRSAATTRCRRRERSTRPTRARQRRVTVEDPVSDLLVPPPPVPTALAVVTPESAGWAARRLRGAPARRRADGRTRHRRARVLRRRDRRARRRALGAWRLARPRRPRDARSPARPTPPTSRPGTRFTVRAPAARSGSASRRQSAAPSRACCPPRASSPRRAATARTSARSTRS